MDGSTPWCDDFAGSPGAPPDPAVWVPETGGGGWGDEQVQRYTVPPANASLTGDGRLAVVARDDSGGSGDGQDVTSARLTTKGRLTVL